jgi:serine/threonine protein kinase
VNPALDPERWAQISALLDELLDLPPAERAARLNQAGLDDTARHHVESMLAADESGAARLDRGGAAAYRELLGGGLDGGAAPAAGARIGPWRIVGELGRGGMGTVYLAERADGHFDQRVALKVVKRGMDTDQVLRRFRAERQILARLAHPRIARLIDGGVTGDGLPYFAMEYVDGVPILAYAAQQALAREDRLRLGDDVADAVQHAHRNLVVHRDLKPSNILVTSDGQVKLLDFGIAKMLGNDDEALTGTGERVMTPEYAAPEQLRGERVTTATDVYALGLLLFELVTGRRFRRDLGSRTGERDLDAILETALREDPGRRYVSVQAFRDDLRRRLAREPVRARRGSGAERKRLRVATLASTLAVVLAVWGLTESRRPPRPAAPPAIVLASPDVSQLAPGESWIGDALQRLILDDLGDAWKIEARAASGAPDPDAILLRPRLWRDGNGRLRAAVGMPAGPSQEIGGGSLRELSESSARRIAETLVPAAQRHPTAVELREVGAADAEAWRLFRRARRAARLQMWERVRDLAQEALRRDPGFPLAWLELAMTYEPSDRARYQALDRTIELGGRARGLSPVARLTVEYAQHSRRLDQSGMVRVVEALGRQPLTSDDLLYLKSRQAELDLEGAVPLLEWIAEKWPQDAAAPKRLARHFLGSREPVSLPLSLRYGQMAVALAPSDVAARADLARALLLSGDEAAARAHLRIMAAADPEEKRDALAGEHNNRLFLLHMSLGDVEEAAIDGRRLLTGSGARHAQGQIALASVELSRGAFDAGLDALGAAAAEYEALKMETAAARAHWERAWQAYSLGRHEEALSSCAHLQRLNQGGGNVAQLTALAAVLSTLARLDSGSSAAQGATVAGLRKALEPAAHGREWQRWRDDYEIVIRHRFQDWAGVLGAYQRREGPVPRLAVTYYAAQAAERLDKEDEAGRLYAQLATHPHGWQQPYRRGQAWLRLGVLRARAGDIRGAQAAFETLLRTWDHAPRDRPEIREAQRRLRELRAATDPKAAAPAPGT